MNSSKYFTCPSGKLRTEFISPMVKSTSPGLSDTTFFVCWMLSFWSNWLSMKRRKNADHEQWARQGRRLFLTCNFAWKRVFAKIGTMETYRLKSSYRLSWQGGQHKLAQTTDSKGTCWAKYFLGNRSGCSSLSSILSLKGILHPGICWCLAEFYKIKTLLALILVVLDFTYQGPSQPDLLVWALYHL